VSLFVLPLGALLLALLVVTVSRCIRNGKLPHLLLACGALGGGAATWVGLRQLYLSSLADWKSVVLVVIGLCAILAAAAVSARLPSLSRSDG
jgi:hypothetical protein